MLLLRHEWHHKVLTQAIQAYHLQHVQRGNHPRAMVQQHFY
ncbi:hypothetical protein DsansV1_C19g0162331 [Dioscorea sansibarensis]